MSEINAVKTFPELVAKFGIEIPLIQRDYVQGRVRDVGELANREDEQSKKLKKKYIAERERRDRFVEQLINALDNPEERSITLTFVYGTLQTTNTNSSRHKTSLIPLDGQQRLTTLFLLSWLLIHKQTEASRALFAERGEFKNLFKGLSSFCYKTRPSSGAFCNSLMMETVRDAKGKISESLKEQSWFGDEWKLDPSVQAMLQMLDKFEECLAGKESSRLLGNLLDGKGISFDLLDMKDYQLTDGLYIKMNGRGKQLTEFENWKSEFIGFLEEKHSRVLYTGIVKENLKRYVGDAPSLGKYFAYAIEHQWTDLFWKYCKEEIEKDKMDLDQLGNAKNVHDCYPVVDDFFMRIFEKFTQICFYITNPGKTDAKDFESTKEIRDQLYGDSANVEALFSYLDVLCSLSNETFENLFYVSDDNQNTMCNGKVRLFDNKNLNLLDRCAKGIDATAESDTLLYALVKYIKEFGYEVDADMKAFVRCIRNNIEGRRFLRKSDRLMSADYFIHKIQTEEYSQPSVAKQIDDLIAQKKNNDCLKQYDEKVAAVEDFDFIRGNLRTVQRIVKSGVSTAHIYEVLKAWSSLSTIEKQQIFIAYGFQGHRASYCNHGTLYLWGGKDNWEPIFAHDDGLNCGDIDTAISGVIEDYLKVSDVNGSVALQKLLTDKINDVKGFDFRYYALKYESFLASHAKGKASCCFISARGEHGVNGLDLISAIYSSKPTLAYHTDPIVFALMKKLIDSSENIEAPSCVLYLTYSTTGADRADLCVYDTAQGRNAPIATFVHKAGKHGTGGWEYLHQIWCDEESNDRVQAAFKMMNKTFPCCQFKERE